MSDIDTHQTDLDKISEIIFERYNKDISVFDSSFLIKTLDRRLSFNELKRYDDYCALLLSDAQESSVFLKALYNTFSQFFRDPLAFAYLEQNILPALAAQKAGFEIRIWSAGCAGGQEAYSIAMLLSDYTDMRSCDLRCRIIATDISEDAISMAKAAIYDESTVQNVKHKHLTKYFKIYNNTYMLIPQIKHQIEFAVYDLLDLKTSFPPESIYGNFDILMCSNMLIYYRPEIRKQILRKLRNSLVEGGYLICGDSEQAMFDNRILFRPVSAPKNIFQSIKGRAAR